MARLAEWPLYPPPMPEPDGPLRALRGGNRFPLAKPISIATKAPSGGFSARPHWLSDGQKQGISLRLAVDLDDRLPMVVQGLHVTAG
jgi:hypothetical protein